jgi:hypothetical protein
MAKIDSPKRFVVEDFKPAERPFASKLFGILNNFMEQVIGIINGRLNFKDNFFAHDTEVIVNTPFTTINVANPLNSPIRGIIVLRVDTLTNSKEILTDGVTVQYTNDTGQIRIYNITGLTPGNKYRLRLLLLP